MRDDNIADYPWLCFSLATLMHDYSRLRANRAAGAERDLVVEAMLNGLSADASAFVGDVAAVPDVVRGGAVRFRDRFREFGRSCWRVRGYRPRDQRYSPLSLFFNFSHNVLKGTIIDAFVWGEPWHLPLNDLLTSLPRRWPDERRAGEAGEDADGVRARQPP